MSDNVVKQGFTDDYQAWDTPIAGVGVDFAPFFSLTSPAPIVSKDSFAPAEVSVVTQSQAKNEDWQVFNAPHEEASFAAAADNSLGEGELPLSADAIDEDSNDTIHTEAYDAGYQEAYDKGSALGQSEGEAKGIELGQQQVQALEQQRNEDMQVALGYLSKVTDTLSDELLQPMQTLAVHLAKEIVRGELSLSSHAIERLIRLSMEQLQTTQSSINIHMNPLEFERLQQHNGLPEQVVLQPSNDVSMGSIKVEHAGSWVEDFIEDRLAQISQQVFGAVDEKFVEPIQAITPKVTSEQDTAQEQDMAPEAGPEHKAAPESDTGPKVAPEQDAAPTQDTPLKAAPESDTGPEVAPEQEAAPESDTGPEVSPEQEAAPAQDTPLKAAPEQDAAPAQDTSLEAAPEQEAAPESDTALEVAPEQDVAPAQDTSLEAAPEQDAAPATDTALEAGPESDPESDIAPKLVPDQEAAPDPDPDTAAEPSDTTTDFVQQHSTATESPDDPGNNIEGGTTNE